MTGMQGRRRWLGNSMTGGGSAGMQGMAVTGECGTRRAAAVEASGHLGGGEYEVCF